MFSPKYSEWVQKRIKYIIDFYGKDFFFGKKVLDLGGGEGDVAIALFRLGADVTLVDAREEHLQKAKKKCPHLRTLRWDLDQSFPVQTVEVYDIILHLGLLCHLRNYQTNLLESCKRSCHLILETAVIDSTDSTLENAVAENRNMLDRAFNNAGSAVSVARLEQLLQEQKVNFQRQDNKVLNSGDYVYDWKSTNQGSHSIHQRRMWFVSNLANVGIRQQEQERHITSAYTSPAIHITHQPNNIPSYSIGMPKRMRQEITHQKSKLKVAVCISGHMRTFERTIYSLKRSVLDLAQCDIFIHTWSTLGALIRHADDRVKLQETDQALDRIINLYQPKKIIVENDFISEVENRVRHIPHNRDIHGLINMFYKIKKCNELKSAYEEENNFKYDIVMRYRPDTQFVAPLDFHQKTNTNLLFFPLHGSYGGLSDQFVYGSSDLMDKYSNLIDHMEKYLTEDKVIFNPEFLVKHHCTAQNLPTSRTNANFVLLRPNGAILNNYETEKRLGFK